MKFLHNKLAHKISSFKINDISRIYTALSQWSGRTLPGD